MSNHILRFDGDIETATRNNKICFHSKTKMLFATIILIYYIYNKLQCLLGRTKGKREALFPEEAHLSY